MMVRELLHPVTERIINELNLDPDVRYDVAIIRISSRGNLVKLADTEDTGINVFADLPDFQTLASMNPDVSARGWPSFTYRDFGSKAAGNRFGWVGLVGRTIFVAVADSAANANLPPEDHDPAGLGRNAFVDLTICAATAGNAANIRAPHRSRWWRNDLWANILMEFINRWLPGCVLWDGPQQVATQGTQRLLTSVEGRQAAAYVEQFMEQTFEKAITNLSAGGRWDRPDRELPLGLRRKRAVLGDGTTKKSMRVEMIPDLWAAAAWALTAIATGRTWADVGQHFEDVGVPLMTTQAAGRTYADLPSNYLRTNSARHLVTKYLDFYRTGTWTERRSTKLPREEIRGYKLKYEAATGRRYIDIPILGMPWAQILTATQWDAFDAAEAEYERNAERRRGAAASARSGDAAALRGVPSWEHDGLQHALFPSTTTAYHWKSREPRRGGWTGADVEIRATLRKDVFHRALGRALIAELEAIDAPLAPVMAREPEPVEDIGALILDVEAGIKDQRRVSKRADDEVLAAGADSDEVDHWRTVGRDARQRIKALQTELADLHAREASGPLDEAIELVEADITEPLLVASLLRDGTRHVAPIVAAALDDYRITSSVRAQAHPTDRDVVRMTASARIPLADGTRHRVDLVWDVVDSHLKAKDHALVEYAIRRWARGDDMEEIAEIFPGWTPARARKAVRNGLVDRGVSRPVADAVIGAPLGSVRSALGATVLEDLALAEGLDPDFVAQVADAYLVAGTSPAVTHWCGTDNIAGIRRALAALAATGTWLTMEDLAARADVSVPLVAIMRESHLIELSPSVPSNRVVSRTCGHGCGTRLSRYLPTPETGSGLLCETCGRAGDATHQAPVPGEYFELAATPTEDDAGDGDLLTSSEAAHRLGLSHHAFGALTASGVIAPAKVVGRRAYRYAPEDLDAFPPEQVARWQASDNRDVADGLLGSTEAARVLGITDATLRKLARGGKIPVAAMKGNRRRYARADIEVYASRRRAL